MWTVLFKSLLIPVGIVLVSIIIFTIGSYITKTRWWERHVCGEFSGPEDCFDCDKLSCEGCSVPEKGRPVLFYE